MQISRRCCSRSRGAAESGNFIDRQTAQEFGIKVSCLLRHHASGKGNVGYLRNLGWFEQKGDLGPAVADLFNRGVNSAHVLDVALVANRLFIDAEYVAENLTMQHGDVQFASLAWAVDDMHGISQCDSNANAAGRRRAKECLQG